MHRESAIATLIRFAHHIADAHSAAELLPLLTEAAVVHLEADGAAVVELRPAGVVHVAAARRVPTTLLGQELETETLDEDLATAVLARCEGRFQQARVLPLVSGQSLFGALVLLFREEDALDEASAHLAEGFVALSAISLERQFRIEELERSVARAREAQSTLIRTEKLRALGQMSAGISHDLRNLMSPLSLRVGLLKRKVKDQPEVLEKLNEIDHTLTRGVELMERMRQFSRQEKNAQAENVDLAALVREAAALSRSRLVGDSAKIKLIEELGDTAPVTLRAGELVSAVVNLIINAVDAIDSRGGTIAVRTGADEQGAWLQVADTGPGMPAEIREHLFEPFFTTKGQAGTGLGLSTIYAFVQRSGGTIDVQTAQGEGTVFTLRFPHADAAALAGTP